MKRVLHVLLNVIGGGVADGGVADGGVADGGVADGGGGGGGHWPEGVGVGFATAVDGSAHLIRDRSWTYIYLRFPFLFPIKPITVTSSHCASLSPFAVARTSTQATSAAITTQATTRTPTSRFVTMSEEAGAALATRVVPAINWKPVFKHL